MDVLHQRESKESKKRRENREKANPGSSEGKFWGGSCGTGLGWLLERMGGQNPERGLWEQYLHSHNSVDTISYQERVT